MHYNHSYSHVMEPTDASKLAEKGWQLFQEAYDIYNTPAPNDDDLDTPPVTLPTPPKGKDLFCLKGIPLSSQVLSPPPLTRHMNTLNVVGNGLRINGSRRISPLPTPPKLRRTTS